MLCNLKRGVIILKNRYPTKPDSFLKYNGNKTYRARKELTTAVFSLERAQQEAPEQPLPEPAPEGVEETVGYISVRTLTASGALPVPDALITIYTFDENGQENEIVHHVTDANGQIPLITLPAIYDPLNPFESSEFFYSAYNLRAQAINYYTVNIIGFKVFPNITTYLTINMIPAPAGPTENSDITVVIPPSPADITNY